MIQGLMDASELSKEFSVYTNIFEANDEPEIFFTSIIIEMFQ